MAGRTGPGSPRRAVQVTRSYAILRLYVALQVTVAGRPRAGLELARLSLGRTAPMLPSKPHLEFHRIDMHSGWETPPGYPPGIEQKILAGALDEERKTGSRTRLLRFAPGVYTSAPFVHEYWEEVYLVAGDLTVGNDANGIGGESFPVGNDANGIGGESFPAGT